MNGDALDLPWQIIRDDGNGETVTVLAVDVGFSDAIARVDADTSGGVFAYQPATGETYPSYPS